MSVNLVKAGHDVRGFDLNADAVAAAVAGVVPTAASNNDFAPTFTTELANKDIGLAISAARDTGTPLEIGEHVQQLFQRLIDSGNAGMDCSAIVKLVDGTLDTAN
jgi:3-hydroxyisobutyrate dehydrogenase